MIRYIVRSLEHVYACRRVCNAYAWKLRGRSDVLTLTETDDVSTCRCFPLLHQDPLTTTSLSALHDLNNSFFIWEEIFLAVSLPFSLSPFLTWSFLKSSLSSNVILQMALRNSYNDNNDIYVNNVNSLHISIRIILFELFSISRSDDSRCLSRDIFERSHDFLRYVSLYRNIFVVSMFLSNLVRMLGKIVGIIYKKYLFIV